MSPTTTSPGGVAVGPEAPADVLRVLVADDEPGMRSGVARVLEGFSASLPDAGGGTVSFAVEGAATGEEALEKLRAAPADLLLLDHKLPGLSGLEVLARLPAEAPRVLTVMITAYATLETAVAATKRGAFDFLAKPFTPDELRATVVKAARHVALQRQARRHAAEKQRIRFEFVSVLAHELKAPLAAIEGNLLDLQAGIFGPSLAAYQPSVGRCVERLRGLRRLVVDLLDLTRIESGERRRALERLDAAAVAAGVLEALRPLGAPRGLAFSLHAPAPVWTMADRGELELVVTNLLDNAVKYNREGGRVDLEVLGERGRVHVRVRDTGIGVAPEDAARLFRDFVRVKTERTRSIPGSGLGLSTVRKVALLYGGDASLRSEPGAGTTVEAVLGEVAPAPGTGSSSG